MGHKTVFTEVPEVLSPKSQCTMDDFDILDPHPDVHALFVLYNRLYFDDALGAASVQWSTQRMTRCVLELYCIREVSRVCVLLTYNYARALVLQVCWDLQLSAGWWLRHYFV